MADLPKTIKIHELPEVSTINDDDIFIVEDRSVTHKIIGKNLIAYIKNHGDISDYYVHQSSINEANGVAPLNENRKIPSDNINFGTTSNTVFDGGRGKALEDGLDAHLLDKNNPHEVNLTQLGVTATSEELNVLDGITASTQELNNINGTTGNIQEQLNTKAPLASPTLTGTPKAPTASAGTNTTQIATTTFVQTAVANHDTSTTAHSDIRDLITGLTTRLNALVDSDDTTLDQLSEIVAYIKNNKSLIDSITTSKVSVSDIVDSLTSTATNKPLSANQGKVLKELIDELTTSLNTHKDDTAIHVSTTDRNNWNAAKTHTDSTHAPSNAQENVIETVEVNGIALTPSSKVVNVTVPTKVSELSNDMGFLTAVDVDISQNHTHENKGILDATTASYTTEEKSKLSGIATGANNYTLPLATSSVRGGAKIGYAQNGKNYPVQLSDEQMYVNVPWTDNNTTYGAAGSGLGLVKSGGDVSISSGVITVNDDSHNHVIGNVDGLQGALDGKAASGHTHDDRYYTESEINTKLNGKANTSHGNHVPATQTANNKVFLRNDNTWQTITPANIGAAASSHSQAASTITAGTFGATGVVAATGTDYTTNRIRNTVFTTTDPGAGTSTSYANGSIICVYE